MGAAVLQGVPVVTHDLDLWIGRPVNRHDEILRPCFDRAATIVDDFKVELPDTTVINFTYEVQGLKSFASELRASKKITDGGQKIAVLPLERIYASKRAVNRPKDRAHLFYLEQAIRLRNKLKRL